LEYVGLLENMRPFDASHDIQVSWRGGSTVEERTRPIYDAWRKEALEAKWAKTSLQEES